MRLSTTTLARGSARRPWLTLGIWAAALVVAAAVIVLVLPGTLTAQYTFLGNPDSQRGRDLLQQRMDMPQKANEVVIVRSTATNAATPAFRAEVLGLQQRIAALGRASSTASSAPTRAATRRSSPPTATRRSSRSSWPAT